MFLRCLNEFGIDELLERMQRIGDALQGYTGKLVFSFADLSCYARVVKNLNNSRVRYIEWEPDLMKETAREISKLNSRWGYSLATCAEQIELDCYGIRHNHCIDEELIVRLAYMDDKLMQHLGVQIGHAQETLWGFESPPAGSIDLGNGCYAVLTGKNRDRDICASTVMPTREKGRYLQITRRICAVKMRRV